MLVLVRIMFLYVHMLLYRMLGARFLAQCCLALTFPVLCLTCHACHTNYSTPCALLSPLCRLQSISFSLYRLTCVYCPMRCCTVPQARRSRTTSGTRRGPRGPRASASPSWASGPTTRTAPTSTRCAAPSAAPHALSRGPQPPYVLISHVQHTV